MGGHCAAGDRRDRIGGVGDGENDFVIGIIEVENRRCSLYLEKASTPHSGWTMATDGASPK